MKIALTVLYVTNLGIVFLSNALMDRYATLLMVNARLLVRMVQTVLMEKVATPIQGFVRNVQTKIALHLIVRSY
jgi:hypothetical protein